MGLKKTQHAVKRFTLYNIRIREGSYISSSPRILTMASLDMDQVVVQSAWVIVLQQSYLPLRV